MDFLTQLAARALKQTPAVHRRPVSLFQAEQLEAEQPGGFHEIEAEIEAARPPARSDRREVGELPVRPVRREADPPRPHSPDGDPHGERETPDPTAARESV